MTIDIEFLDPENLLLDIFHYFVCQLQTERQIYWILAAIFNFVAVLFHSLGQLGHSSKMLTSDPNNHPG